MSKPAPEVAPVAVEAEMSSEEYRAMVELAKNSGPDDCEMCGS
jgi:ribonucleoside-diphosphate reductase alpha chain